MDSKKKMATAKGGVTRVLGLLEEQEGLEPKELKSAVLERLTTRLDKAEELYESAFLTIEDPTEDDERSQMEFLTNLDDARAGIDHLKLVIVTHGLGEDLLELLEYWESMDEDTLRVKVVRDIDTLQAQFDHFVEVTRPRRLASSPHVKELIRQSRFRIDKLKDAAPTSTTPTPAPSVKGLGVPEGTRPGLKSLTLPMPTFHGDLADWRAYWKRFNEYLDKIPGLTSSERLSYLYESLKETSAKEIVQRVIRYGKSFETATEELKIKYDQPRQVYLGVTHTISSMPGTTYDSKSFYKTADSLVSMMHAISTYGDGSASQLLTAFAENTMDDRSRLEWKRHIVDPSKIPSSEEMVKFLHHHATLLGGENVRSTATKPSPGKHIPFKSHSTFKEKSKNVSLLSTNTGYSCKLCDEKEHPLFFCGKFKSLDVPARRKFMSKSPYCFNCLVPGHNAKQCHSKKTCRDCGNKHHSLLHLEEVSKTQASTSTTTSNTDPPQPSLTSETSLSLPVPRPTTILWVCQAKVEQEGLSHVVRGILDPGSTVSFVTDRLVKTMKLKTSPLITEVTGIGSTHAGTCKNESEVLLKSPYEHSAPPVQVRATVIKSIVGDTPSTDLLKEVDTSFTNSLNLSDPNFKTPGGIDLLLGQDVLGQVLKDGVVRSTKNKLYAINTIFGWVVGGSCKNSTEAALTHICCHATTATDTDNLLKAFWETEEPPSQFMMKDEDQQALQHFHQTQTREADGRYIVSLPKKQTENKLGNSRRQALQRYNSNKQTLLRKGKWDEFLTALQEYRDLGHAEPVSIEDLNKPTHDSYYLPMHGVVKESSTTTKLRVVFDASAKTTSGYSLNDLLLSGPISYPLLTNILLSFRLHKIGLSADISKMFREVSLHNKDRDCHRFLFEDDGKVQDWRMKRLTFGVNCSPFLATQVLRQLAKDYSKEFPEAAQAILKSFYVDDFLSGADSFENATKLRQSLNELLERGRMTLRKWRSNSPALKNTIPENLLEKENVHLIQAPSECHKTLGIHWNTKTDTLHVATPTLHSDDSPTKRQVLSDVARTFDILGWFTPVTIQLKILLQRTWMLGLEWDHVLPNDLVSIWQQWREELPLVTNHPISRQYFNPEKEIHSLQLHGFCDASQLAIAAVVYVRALYTDTTVSVVLVVAKSRVAPVKPMTIPKLELSSAVLLSKLLHTVMVELTINIADVFAWSDSTIALGWIRTPPVRLTTFVANRVVELTDRIPPVNWKHVPTSSNPADVASRGIAARELIQFQLWWHGPDWLHLSSNHWPIQDSGVRTSTLPNLKSFALTIQSEPPDTEHIINNFSSFRTCVNVIAWLYRFIHNAKKNKETRLFLSSLTLEEIKHAEIILLKKHQSVFFSKDIATISAGATVSTSSRLHPLHPFMDKNGLIRVGGRLNNSKLSYQQMHPIVLCRKSHLTLILVRQLHLTNSHAGPTLLLGLLSQQYYILGARRLIRKVSRDCIPCQREYARTATQQMGNLPHSRVRPSTPFAKTGTDFAGPLTLRKGHTRKPVYVKAYICLFVCFSTRAIHLELVSDLSTEAFLAAFRRFAARRGCPEEVHSDNGSNYIGANHELENMYHLLTKETSSKLICRYFNNARIKWSFIPGKAPHFGGLWEAGIKSAKSLLRKTVGSHSLTFEECVTILADIEATLNSRPLCPLDSQPEDGIEVLTPGHFLIGKPLKALPQPPSEQIPLTARRRWNLCQKLAAEFWSRWTTDYLQSLQRRQKWTNKSNNLQCGQVVLIKDQELFVRTWPLGVITEVHPGRDGLVRAVTVRTSKGVYRRPVTRIILLFDPDENTSHLLPGEDVQASLQA